MLARLMITTLLTTALMAHAQDVASFLAGMQTTLTGAGLTKSAMALGNINGTDAGQRLLGGIMSLPSATFFAPVDSAWNDTVLNGDAEVLVGILAYHMATLTVTPDSLTDPPSYDVVFSMYRSSDDALPNDQTQVLVVQKQVSPPGVIILRPDSNTTTTGNQMSFQQTIIWAVPEIIARPYDSLGVMDKNIIYADNSAPVQMTNFCVTAHMADRWGACKGCTYFVPINQAIAAISGDLYGLPGSTQVAVMENHFLNGTTIYTPQLFSGSSLTTAAGQQMTYSNNGTGQYLQVGNSAAKIIRPDIPLYNGVMHIVDNVFFDQMEDTAVANSAAVSALSASPTGVPEVQGEIQTTLTVNVPSTSSSTNTATASVSGSSTSAKASGSSGVALRVSEKVGLSMIGSWISIFFCGAMLGF